jgi:uncharacterized protein YjbJ (UPF0337 family)
MDSDRITGAAQQIGGKVQDVVGRVTGDHGLRAEGMLDEAAGTARNLYGQAKDGLRDAADTVTDYAGMAQDRVHRAVDAVSDHASHAYQDGRQRLRGGARAVENQIEDHPLMGLMIAGTVGYLLGVLLHMRR